MKDALKAAVIEGSPLTRLQFLAGYALSIGPILFATFLTYGIVPYVRMLGNDQAASAIDIVLNVFQLVWLVAILYAQFQFTKARLRDIGRVPANRLKRTAIQYFAMRFVPGLDAVAFFYLLFVPSGPKSIESTHLQGAA